MAPGCNYSLLFLMILGITSSSTQAKIGSNVQDGMDDVTRIIGGTETTIEDFPWQVLVISRTRDDYAKNCGGSILSNAWIMSAAHCFPEKARGIYVFAGITDITLLTDPNRQMNFFTENEIEDHLYIHPQYNKSTFNNDIALIELKKPLTFNTRVKPIPLANPSDFIPGKELITSGWGKTTDDETAKYPDVLQYVDGLELLSREECRKYWKEIHRKACREECNEMSMEECREHCKVIENVVTNKMICHKTENRNACEGDSGGPVITGIGNRNGEPYVQIGINSFVSHYKCEMNSFDYTTAVFTDVAKFTNWINRTISKRCMSGNKRCLRLASKGMCKRKNVSKKCMKTCTECGFPN